jgi:hypothetical protein
LPSLLSPGEKRRTRDEDGSLAGVLRSGRNKRIGDFKASETNQGNAV